MGPALINGLLSALGGYLSMHSTVLASLGLSQDQILVMVTGLLNSALTFVQHHLTATLTSAPQAGVAPSVAAGAVPVK